MLPGATADCATRKGASAPHGGFRVAQAEGWACVIGNINNTEGASLMVRMDNLPLEGLVKDEYDGEFGERIHRLQGAGTR